MFAVFSAAVRYIDITVAVNFNVIEKLGFVWLDAGTPETLLEAGVLVQAIEQCQGLKIACLEEIAWQAGWISAAVLRQRASQLGTTQYSAYLGNLLEVKH